MADKKPRQLISFDYALKYVLRNKANFADNTKLFSNILEACATKIFLPNQNAMQKGSEKLIGLFELYTSFGLNEAQIGIIKNAQPKQEYFIHSKLGSRLISFDLGKIAQAFCCAGVEKVPQIKQLIKEYPNNWQQIYISNISNK